MSQVYIFSGGERWQCTVSEQDENVKWVLQGKEKMKATLVIDVIPDPDLDPSLYQNYELYYVSIQDNAALKYQYKSE